MHTDESMRDYVSEKSSRSPQGQGNRQPFIT
jgi:hypothetical protein